MCRVGDFKGVDHFEDFRLKGYVSRQYLRTIKWRNGYPTILPLKVFTQRHFVADVIRLKLNFIKKSLSEPFFGGLSLRGNVRTCLLYTSDAADE